MYKQALILLVVVGFVACDLNIQSNKSAADDAYVVDGPVGILPSPPQVNRPVHHAGVGGAQFGAHLRDIYSTTKEHARKVYIESKPALEGLQGDIKVTVDHIKANPRVAKSIDAATNGVNTARDKLKPIIDRTGKRVQGILSKVQEHRMKKKENMQAPSPHGQEQVAEQVHVGAAPEVPAAEAI